MPVGHWVTVAERARSASFLGLDAILISGPEAGVPFAMSDLRAAKDAVPQTPVLANTGVTAERLAETLAVADGVIVGTSLKVDGITWNPVDPRGPEGSWIPRARCAQWLAELAQSAHRSCRARTVRAMARDAQR